MALYKFCIIIIISSSSSSITRKYTGRTLQNTAYIYIVT